VIVVFLRTTDMELYIARPGNIVKMSDKKANEEISKGNAKQYTGEFPPRFKDRRPETKTKIQLKDLK